MYPKLFTLYAAFLKDPFNKDNQLLRQVLLDTSSNILIGNREAGKKDLLVIRLWMTNEKGRVACAIDSN